MSGALWIMVWALVSLLSPAPAGQNPEILPSAYKLFGNVQIRCTVGEAAVGFLFIQDIPTNPDAAGIADSFPMSADQPGINLLGFDFVDDAGSSVPALDEFHVGDWMNFQLVFSASGGLAGPSDPQIGSIPPVIHVQAFVDDVLACRKVYVLEPGLATMADLTSGPGAQPLGANMSRGLAFAMGISGFEPGESELRVELSARGFAKGVAGPQRAETSLTLPPQTLTVREPLGFTLRPPARDLAHEVPVSAVVSVATRTMSASQARASFGGDFLFGWVNTEKTGGVGVTINRDRFVQSVGHTGCGLMPPHPERNTQLFQDNTYDYRVFRFGGPPYTAAGQLPDFEVGDFGTPASCAGGTFYDANLCDCVPIAIDVDPEPDFEPRLIGADDPVDLWTPTGPDVFFNDPPPGGPPFNPPPFIPDPPPMGGSADLVLEKIAFPDPVPPGAVLTYTIDTTNLGPDTATGVEFTDTLPPGITFTGATPSQGVCSDDGTTVNCQLGNIPMNGTIVVNIDTEVVNDPPQTITNTTSVLGNELDPFPGNNTATFTTTVDIPPTASSADLTISKSDGGQDPIAPGSTITYGFDFFNNGPDTATNVTVVDTVPAGLIVQDPVAIPGGSCTRVGNVITCTVASLAPGTGVLGQYSAVVPESLAGTVITNTATITGNETDPDTSNNTASEPTTVSALAPPPPGADLCAFGVNNNSVWDGTGACGFGQSLFFCGNPADPNLLVISAFGGANQTVTCDGTGFCGNNNTIFGNPLHIVRIVLEALGIRLTATETDANGVPTGNTCTEIFSESINFPGSPLDTFQLPAIAPAGRSPNRDDADEPPGGRR